MVSGQDAPVSDTCPSSGRTMRPHNGRRSRHPLPCACLGEVGWDEKRPWAGSTAGKTQAPPSLTPLAITWPIMWPGSPQGQGAAGQDLRDALLKKHGSWTDGTGPVAGMKIEFLLRKGTGTDGLGVVRYVLTVKQAMTSHQANLVATRSWATKKRCSGMHPETHQ